MLYCISKPLADDTVGSVNAALQVFAGTVNVGAAGKITTLTVLLVAHEPAPVAPAAVLPHAAVNTYCACMVWHPADVEIVGEAENAPPLILY